MRISDCGFRIGRAFRFFEPCMRKSKILSSWDCPYVHFLDYVLAAQIADFGLEERSVVRKSKILPSWDYPRIHFRDCALHIRFLPKQMPRTTRESYFINKINSVFSVRLFPWPSKSPATAARAAHDVSQRNQD